MDQRRPSGDPDAYAEWSPSEKTALTEMVQTGQTFHSMCEKLERPPLAVAMAVLLEKDPINHCKEVLHRGLPNIKSQTSN